MPARAAACHAPMATPLGGLVRSWPKTQTLQSKPWSLVCWQRTAVFPPYSMRGQVHCYATATGPARSVRRAREASAPPAPCIISYKGAAATPAPSILWHWPVATSFLLGHCWKHGVLNASSALCGGGALPKANLQAPPPPPPPGRMGGSDISTRVSMGHGLLARPANGTAGLATIAKQTMRMQVHHVHHVDHACARRKQAQPYEVQSASWLANAP